MYCASCGQACPPNTKFCNKCGVKLNAGVAVAAPASRFRRFIWVVCIAVVMITAFSLVLFFQQRETVETQTNAIRTVLYLYAAAMNNADFEAAERLFVRGTTDAWRIQRNIQFFMTSCPNSIILFHPGVFLDFSSFSYALDIHEITTNNNDTETATVFASQRKTAECTLCFSLNRHLLIQEQAVTFNMRKIRNYWYIESLETAS